MRVVSISIELLVFFYLFYKLVKEDFLLIRKGISPESMYNIAFLTGLVALFFGRVGYVFFHYTKNYLKPLVFLALPYYPGISLLGSIIGGILFIIYISYLKKLPTLRLLDFFSIAIVGILPIGYLNYFLFEVKNRPVIFLIISIVYAVLFVIFYSVVLPKIFRGELKDGSASMLFLSSYTVLSLLIFLLSSGKNAIPAIIYTGILLVIFFFSVWVLWKLNFSLRNRNRH